MTQQNSNSAGFIDKGYMDPTNTTGKNFSNLSFVEGKRALSKAENLAKLGKVDEANSYLVNFTNLTGMHHKELDKGWFFQNSKKNIAVLRNLSEEYNLTTINRYRDEALRRGDNFTSEQYMKLYNKANHASVNEEAALQTSEFLDETLAKITRSDSVAGITDIALSKLDEIRAQHLYGENNIEDHLNKRFKELDSKNWTFYAADKSKDFVGGVMANVTGILDIAGDIYSFISAEPNPIQATNRLATSMGVDINSKMYQLGVLSGFAMHSPIASATSAYRSAKAISGMEASLIALKAYTERGKATANFIQAGLAMTLMHGAGAAAEKILSSVNMNENRKKALPNLIGVGAGGLIHYIASTKGLGSYEKAVEGKTSSPFGEGESVSAKVAQEIKGVFNEQQPSSSVQESAKTTDISKPSKLAESDRSVAMDNIIETNNKLSKRRASQVVDNSEIASPADAVAVQRIQDKINEAKLTSGKNYQDALIIDNEIKNLNPTNVKEGARNSSNYSRNIENDGKLKSLDSDIKTDVTVLYDLSNELANTPPSEVANNVLQDVVKEKAVSGVEAEMKDVTKYVSSVIPSKTISRLAEKGGLITSDIFKFEAEKLRYSNPELAQQLNRLSNIVETTLGYESQLFTQDGAFASELLNKVDKARTETLLELGEISEQQIDLSKFKDENYRNDITEEGLSSIKSQISEKFNQNYESLDNNIEAFYNNNPTELKLTKLGASEVINVLDKATVTDINGVKDYVFAPFIDKIAKSERIPRQAVSEYLKGLIENDGSTKGIASNLREVERILKSAVTKARTVAEAGRQRGGIQDSYIRDVVSEFSNIVDSSFEKSFENPEQESTYRSLKRAYASYAQDRAAIKADRFATTETTQFNVMRKNPKLYNNLKSHLSGVEINPNDPIAKLDQLLKASSIEKLIDVGVNKEVSLAEKKSIVKHMQENRNIIEELYSKERFAELFELGEHIDSSRERLTAIKKISKSSDAKSAINEQMESLANEAGYIGNSINILRKGLKAVGLVFLPAAKGALKYVTGAKFASSALSGAETVLKSNKATKLAKSALSLEATPAYKAIVVRAFADNIAKNNGYVTTNRGR